MKTVYAANKPLTAPNITAIVGGGTVVANTYYFWSKTRSRGGYSAASAVQTLVVSATGQISIAAGNFSPLQYEDLHEHLIHISTTNDITTSRVIYKYNYFTDDEVTLNTPATINLTANSIVNGATSYATPTDVATLASVPNGYRVAIISTGFMYEFVSGSTVTADGLTVLTHSSGRWIKTRTNTLYEPDTSALTDIVGVSSPLLISASLKNINDDAVPLKYWIINDSGTSVANTRLNLAEYCSDASFLLKFDVTVIGYLNLSTFLLDTTGINNVGVALEYPTIDISLNKSLPNNSAVVVQVAPTTQVLNNLVSKTFVSVYPRIVGYGILRENLYWSDAMTDIASLKALNNVQYQDNQVRFVKSVNHPYVFNAASAAVDNGDTVIAPNTNPPTGRWLIFDLAIPDGSVGLSKLSPGVVEALTDTIRTNTVTINAPSNYTVNLDDAYDYIVLKTPPNDLGNTISEINISATLANNQTKSQVVELVQNTGVLAFHASILFPSGSTPILSGNGKSDVLLFTIRKDAAGIIKKRGMLVTKDAG
jgi:hypothetical protein